MPMYEYECEAHGIFELLRPLSEYAEAACCPLCEVAAERVLSVPHLCGVPRRTIVARERNERSRHEPRVFSRSDDSCASRSDERQLPSRSSAPKLRSYSGARPWVIEHG